jgi:hypothetical protein
MQQHLICFSALLSAPVKTEAIAQPTEPTRGESPRSLSTGALSSVRPMLQAVRDQRRPFVRELGLAVQLPVGDIVEEYEPDLAAPLFLGQEAELDPFNCHFTDSALTGTRRPQHLAGPYLREVRVLRGDALLLLAGEIQGVVLRVQANGHFAADLVLVHMSMMVFRDALQGCQQTFPFQCPASVVNNKRQCAKAECD